MHSQHEENYLKAIFKLSLEEAASAVSTSALARELEVQAASVTDMIKKLAAKELVEYEKYQGVLLTGKGRSVAVDIIRKHRIWEVFLVEKLGFGWSEVHDIAEQLEHIQSEALINRLDDFLDNPSFDPHGGPIPDKEGHLPDRQTVLLSTLPEGSETIVAGVKDDSRELLEYLEEQSLLIGTRLQVLKHLPFDDSMVLEAPSGKLAISRKVADNLLVRPPKGVLKTK
ncbi:MAG: metal-dependent transcriptional regulator [Saprospirales bacterium]|nr:metal-dependent transcriptional regulator [Saprospirales bacterium]MBK8490305.1 metal-dependent transcriptional regulator [Saprospirales bacterium]